MEGWEKTRGKPEKDKRENSRERPTTKNLAEMFVELEPVWEDPKEEQEDGETKQHNSGHDADGVPNLSSGSCHEAMERQAVQSKSQTDVALRDSETQEVTYISRALPPSLMRASAVKPKL